MYVACEDVSRRGDFIVYKQGLYRPMRSAKCSEAGLTQAISQSETRSRDHDLWLLCMICIRSQAGASPPLFGRISTPFNFCPPCRSNTNSLYPAYGTVILHYAPTRPTDLTSSCIVHRPIELTSLCSVCDQLPTSADNVTLLAFAAERRPRAAIDRCLQAAGPTAANSPLWRAAAE